MDLATGWDFDISSDRRRAIEVIESEKPRLLVGSPPCALFGNLPELNKAIYKDNLRWLDDFELNMQKAIRHVNYCCELYWMQMKAGRYWLHEHPSSAKSWKLDKIKMLLDDSRVSIVQTHVSVRHEEQASRHWQ